MSGRRISHQIDGLLAGMVLGAPQRPPPQQHPQETSRTGQWPGKTGRRGSTGTSTTLSSILFSKLFIADELSINEKTKFKKKELKKLKNINNLPIGDGSSKLPELEAALARSQSS